LLWLFFLVETSARIDSLDSWRVTTDVTLGRLWGHEGAPPGELMKTALGACLRRNVVLNLRSSAFICGFKLLRRVKVTRIGAPRLGRVDFRRITAGINPGQL